MKKILFLLLVFFAQESFGQTWYNDTLRVGWWHGSKIDTAYLNMSEFVFTGDVTTSGGSLLTTISNNAVTTSKINNSAVTLAKIANASANSKLLGSGSSGSGSPYSEITLGTNLTMSGTTLNSTGGNSLTIVDLSDGSGSTIRDSNMQSSPFLIAATAKPANPQWVMGIRTQDIPTTGSGAYVQQWECWVSFAGKNTDGANSRTINWRLTRNGTDWAGTSDASIACPTATPFYKVFSKFGASGVAAGDTIGIKLWGSVTNLLDLRAVTLYIVPSKFIRATNGFQIFNSASVSYFRASVTGAIGGITYVATNPSYQFSITDNNLSLFGLSFSTTGTNILSDPLYAAMYNSSANFANVNNFASAVTAAINLYGFSSATTSLLRYIYVH